MELDDVAFLVGHQNAEAGGFFHRDFVDGDDAVGLILFGRLEHIVISAGIDVVARKNQDVFRIDHIEPVEVLINRVGGT